MFGIMRGVVFACFVAAWAALGVSAHAQEWKQTDGAAKDVGVGANGAVWVIGTNPVPGGYDIWRRNGSAWESIPGGAVRIAVGPAGEAWVVNDTDNLFRYDGKNFVALPVNAKDVGVGANGTAWIIGTQREAGGYAIYRSTNNGASWTKVAGSALRVSVDPAGNAWVVNNSNNVFRYDGSQFVALPGSASDVGVGADGAAWVIGADGGIYRFENGNWAKKTGGAAQVAAGPNGVVWVVNAGGAIYQAQLATPVSIAPAVVNVQPPQTSGPIVIQGTTSIPVTSAIPTAPTAAPAAAPIDPKNPWRVFPRGGAYEAQILQAIRFQRFANLVILGGQTPTLSPLEAAVADIALTSTESYFAANPLPPDQAIARVKSDVNARRSVVTFVGLGVGERARGKGRDAQTVALRQWASEVYRSIKIKSAKAMLDEYAKWARDPCGYEKKPAAQCKTIAGLLSPPRPSQDLIARAAIGSVMAGTADDVAVTAAVGITAAATAASAAALMSGLGVVVAPAVAGASGVVFTPAITTSMFAAFGGTFSSAVSASTTASAGAIGATSWAGVVAAPVAAAVLVVVVGTTEGIAVVEAARIEPMLKLKLGAAMTDNIVIENELADEKERDFFFLAYQAAAANNFYVPANTVDGQVRFFCQAGYVCRFKLAYNQGGAVKNLSTKELAVGHEETFAIPYNATNIVASGEWFDGFNWKSLFSRNLAKPTYIGFTAFGTIFNPQVKDEYPEISNIQAPPNQLVVTQGGGYVAHIRVSYTLNGVAQRVVDVGDARAGWRQEINIPKEATNIRLEAWSATGLAWEPWKSIIDKTWPVPPNACVKVYNTTLDPKWNSECR